MNNENFADKLGRLMSEMHDLPEADREAAHRLTAESAARQEKLRETVKTLQDSLDHLRLSVKYLVFDLEATRRENQYLRALLGHEGPGPKSNAS